MCFRIVVFIETWLAMKLQTPRIQHKSIQPTALHNSPERGCQFPDWLLLYFENYNSFSLLSYRNPYTCVSGGSQLLFRNVRASSWIQEKSPLPQQLQFKLCAQTSLAASSAHRTDSPGSIPFWRRWGKSSYSTNMVPSPQLFLHLVEVVVIHVEAKSKDSKNLRTPKPSVQAFPHEAELVFFSNQPHLRRLTNPVLFSTHTGSNCPSSSPSSPRTS